MAIPVNISDLINQRVVESARIEYKANWNPEPCLHTICAFANDIDNWGGGYIIIGVEEREGMPGSPVSGIHFVTVCVQRRRSWSVTKRTLPFSSLSRFADSVNGDFEKNT